MEVVILCGGQGTRLREETEFIPKPMVKIGNYPILWHIMKYYRSFGIRDFILCLGYRSEIIRDYFLNFNNRTNDARIDLATGIVTCLQADASIDWKVTMVDTGELTQTGTRIKRALKYVNGDRFMATYGDGLCNVDINALLKHHEDVGQTATVTGVHPSSRFGELGIEGDVIKTFHEKPQVNEGWINGGFFVFERKAFDLIQDNEDLPLETSVLQTLAQQGQLAVHQHHDFWQCMDTYREMQMLNKMWNGDKAPWKIWD